MIDSRGIAELCRAIADCGRSVTIVAASKTRPIEELRALSEIMPEAVFGENRVQELLSKYDPALKWHFIGRLQTNKVKYIVDKVQLIHSLDRLPLAAEIDRQAAKTGKIQDCLVEVNVGGEPEKGGVSPEELSDMLDALGQFEHIRVRGLMTVMPNLGEGEALDALYQKLQRLYRHEMDVKRPNVAMEILSAGMSGDYKTALRYGSNMLRPGRAIFGERAYATSDISDK